MIASTVAFKITDEALTTVGLTVQTDRTRTLIRELEEEADRVRVSGDSWQNDHGNYSWFVTESVLEKRTSLIELAYLVDELGVAEVGTRDEYWATTLPTIIRSFLREMLQDVIRLSAGEDSFYDWGRQEDDTT